MTTATAMEATEATEATATGWQFLFVDSFDLVLWVFVAVAAAVQLLLHA